MNYQPLMDALATARQLAQETGDSDLIALTVMTYADAQHFIAKLTSREQMSIREASATLRARKQS